MVRFVKVGETSELLPGEGKTVAVEGHSIALFNVDGTFYAIENTCPHAGGPLGEGDLDGDVVTCPWHGSQFDVLTGKVLGRPAGSDVRSYAVKVERSDVLVELA